MTRRTGLVAIGIIVFQCANPEMARSGSPPVATESVEIRASGGQNGDAFGYVAVSGDIIVVGAPLVDVPISNAGVAYVFQNGGGTWTQVAKLRMSDEANGDEFGIAVAVDGDTIGVGTWFKDSVAPDAGAVYMYVKPVGGWGDMTETARITPPDGASGDQFGAPLVIRGDTLVAGAANGTCGAVSSGAGYVFVRDGSAWNFQAKLCASDASTGELFGAGVGLDGDTAIIGAPLDDVAGGSGSAYVFTRLGSAWVEEAKLVPSDADTGDRFGHQVAVDGAMAIIGAPYANAAYVFDKGPNGLWDAGSTDQEAKLVDPEGVGGIFGHAVAVRNGVAVVGAVHASGVAPATGAAYVFTRHGTDWSAQWKLVSSDGSTGDSFAYAGWNGVSLGGNVVVVGAQNHTHGSAGGAAYIYGMVFDVPALSPLGLGLLCVAMLIAGYYVIRRRRVPRLPASVRCSRA